MSVIEVLHSSRYDITAPFDEVIATHASCNKRPVHYCLTELLGIFLADHCHAAYTSRCGYM